MQLVLKYLKRTSTYSLYLDGKARDVTYEVYTDASFACQPKERKSVTGYVIQMAGTSVSWCSSKQGGVSLSTAEAKLIALSEGAKLVVAFPKRDGIPTKSTSAGWV
ncbi:LOW QUALITY PROTEIN: Retrotransposon Tca5 Polyprotein [Phytophthora megakarya]|uniref:Retrotransposon Tca5 Polyprotein n=1 Tax=Phytophthora megakarya TaxID=4795 RepID=A0A225V2V0_9STRA|nr:LOW QUALITY PROTEIN: Retrotransposon Tca5 Polyprotein [Phytophthora megakarya]